MQIFLADLSFLPQVLDITQNAAVWLKARGFRQWNSFLDDATAIKILKKRFEEGEVYLGKQNGICVATITLQFNDDFWGEWGNDPGALYIHTMAIHRHFAGRGLGTRLLEFAAEKAVAAGRCKIRLDCVAENIRLCRYYVDAGYLNISAKHWDGLELLMKEKIL